MTPRERSRHREHRAQMIREHGRALKEMLPVEPLPDDFTALLGKLPSTGLGAGK